MEGADFLRDLAFVLAAALVVGWGCRAAGLPVVAGYLAAGALLGPFGLPGAPISDVGRVQTLAQIGLAFVIFGIGMGLGVQRLRRLGASVVLGTFLASVMILVVVRLAAAAIGLDPNAGLAMAAIMMISSSAIVARLLMETDSAHERHGQIALGVTVLEDVVAVVMLTVLGSAGVGTQESGVAVLPDTLRRIAVFVVFVAGASLLLVPWLIRKLSRHSSTEMQNIAVAALLFLASLGSVEAGFSLALGAFLLGSVVASTEFRGQIERSLEGLRDVFGAVFFVSMGMLFDARLFVGIWPWALALAVVVVVVRVVAVSLGLALSGVDSRDALRAALCVTALGEFSFVAARIAVDEGFAPPVLYPLAVALGFLTTITAPVFVSHSAGITAWIERATPGWLTRLELLYRGWFNALSGFVGRNLLWKLTRKRIIQIVVEAVFVSGAVLFLSPVTEALAGWLRNSLPGAQWIEPAVTAAVLLPLAVLVFAIWRNMEALAMIWSESLARATHSREAVRSVLQPAFRIAAFVLLLLWLAVLVPSVFGTRWVLLGAIIAVTGLLAFGWRAMIRWHSRAEIGLNAMLGEGYAESTRGEAVDLHAAAHWDLHVRELRIPDTSRACGAALSELNFRTEFDCTVAGVDRRGVVISNPGGDTVLYPDDILLVLGRSEDLDRVESWLEKPVREDGTPRRDIAELQLGTVQVPEGSHAAGRTLAMLRLPEEVGVTVVGIKREGRQIANAGPGNTLEERDQVLVLGTGRQIREFQNWLGTSAGSRDSHGD